MATLKGLSLALLGAKMVSLIIICKKLISEKLSLAGKQLTRGDLEGLLKASADLIRNKNKS